jgi:hypothetical protein
VQAMDRTTVVAMLLQNLVSRWATNHVQGSAQQSQFQSRMVKYGMGILGSRIAPSRDCDEIVVSNLIRKQCESSCDSLQRSLIYVGLAYI